MNQQELQLTTGGGKQKRRELDFYPTPPSCTIALLEFLQLPRNRIACDPASGDGAMSKVLEKYFDTVISSDINPNGYGIGAVDFLTSSPPKCDFICTNPPFELAEQFIRRALTIAPNVAMLMKTQYWHAAKRLELFEEYTPTFILPLTWRPDFRADEKKKKNGSTMDVCWTVWKQGNNAQCRYIPLRRPK